MDLEWETLDTVSINNGSVGTSSINNGNCNILSKEELEQQFAGKDCTYDELKVIVRSTIANLEVLDYNDIDAELKQMMKAVQLTPNPTTFELCENLALTQGYITRASELLNLIENEYNTRKRAIDMLFDANQTVSKLSSVDKRKGESTLRFPILLLKFNDIMNLRNNATLTMNNLKSIKETLSRQQSVIDAQITLGEYRKKMPHEFTNSPENEGKDYKSGVISSW